MAAAALEEFELLFVLHPLGHDVEVELVAQVDHHSGDRRALRVDVDVAHEVLSDLERGDREALQVAHRRVARAEVVDRDAYSDVPELAERLENMLDVVHRDALGDLELKHRGIEVRCLQSGPDVGRNILLNELTSREVDADAPEVMARRMPLRRCRTRGAQNPVPEFAHVAGLLGKLDERTRREGSVDGVVPADERL